MCMLQGRLDFLKGVVQIASYRYRSKINHSIWLSLHYKKKKKKDINNKTQDLTSKAEDTNIIPNTLLSGFQAIDAISIPK